jgi:5'-nucleotidase
MHILLTNDDGYYAEGIQTLACFLRKADNEVSIVAPLYEKSASSHSLTLRKTIRVDRISDTDYTVDGTPVDSIIIAFQKLINKPIDLIISGINSGQNMGEDIHYSGTVAAAKEAVFFGYKAIAISINSYKDQKYDAAAKWLCGMLKSNLIDYINNNMVLNINVPNIPYDKAKGIRLTSTGHRKYYNFIQLIEEDEKGFSYVIGGENPIWDDIKGSDSEAIKDGYISITPLGFDMTKGESFPLLLDWLEDHSFQQMLMDR